jgi:Kef-type K+ transport system membrane component KefB
LHQPVILGYILAGVVIGPHLGFKLITNPQAIDFSSELGLIALLFMVGLELDLRRIAQSGRAILVVAIIQFVVCVALGLGFFNLSFFGSSKLAPYYLAITFAMSSTMIVVKLLYDKFELDTLPGRFTLGVLVLQDAWAIIFLAIQPDLENPELGILAISLLKGIGLVAGCFLIRFLFLSRIFKSIAKNPELVIVTALGWCFIVSFISGDIAGLSRAMGALIAGVTLSTLPYKEEISDKITSIRSFFLILFFVALGMKVTQPSLQTFIVSLIASLFLIATRFASLSLPLFLMKKGIRVSILVPLNLAQISEFALVIVALGVNYGHVDVSVMTIVLFTLMITATASTYMITYSHTIYLAISHALSKFGVREAGLEIAGADNNKEEEGYRPILFLGFYRIANSLLNSLLKQEPSIRDKLLVLDFNPQVHQELTTRSVKCVFGDLGNTGMLRTGGIEKAKVVVSTIPDTILKGTSNMTLLTHTRRVNPSARVIVTAESVEEAKRLWAAGADFVFLPHLEASDRLAPLIYQLLNDDTIPAICTLYRQRLTEQTEEFIK